MGALLVVLMVEHSIKLLGQKYEEKMEVYGLYCKDSIYLKTADKRPTI